MRKRIFIVAPSVGAPETDKIHHICVHSGRMSIHDCYGMDKFKIVADRLSLPAAIRFAKRLGAKRPAVI